MLLADNKLHLSNLPAAKVPGLYVHIPFCFHKCHYCDFYSITRQEPERMQHFVDLLIRELQMWQAHAPQAILKPRTIFFGGGTPSLLPMDAMQRLLEGIRARVDLSDLQEWTVEVNPATAALEYCQMMRQMGVDRISFGAQSFDPADLKLLERHHQPDDVPRSLELARQAGFTRLNVDLIYAIPGQTLEGWLANLHRAVALKTSHVSAYNLTYEPNTAMAVRLRLKQFIATGEDLELSMLHTARKTLAEAGYQAYEVSNYALPGEHCRHNLAYWQGENYIGLGPSAASHVSGWRWKNKGHLGQWESSLADNNLPIAEAETLSPLRRADELAMLRLRLADGLVFSDFAERTGYDARILYADPLDRYGKSGLLCVTDTAATLTDRGINVADALASEFLLHNDAR